MEESLDEVIQSYLTVIGISLSITCLLTVVMTYARFPTLRTIPGLVLLGLSLSLLAYQALLLASPYTTSYGCKASNSSRSGFSRYVTFALSIPSSIVAVTFILGETEVIHVGYGESQSCWISEKLALIIFFYVPVAIMLVFNAVSLIRTIFSIRNDTKLTKSVKRSVESNKRSRNAKIYMKLSTVTGVTWLLGFGAAHNTIVAYLYVIVNSLQAPNNLRSNFK
ncbi:putative adhesion G protein-coupled receptor E4P [Dendronephthya gigantea]|uniref:putative adhesion G protein-coupled receptor E4P n=1 Tax=Dendronephthya gigantea TaxID=151771 RepID=UPI00106D2D78|nr:putative adhesion G protein-coupled receptor E4P [Dendronephthya gigantea]